MISHRTSGDEPTLLDALNQLRAAGYGGQLIAKPDGHVRCTTCDATSRADEISVAGYYRLEGTSDVADMNLLTWSQCPACDSGGTLILGYGPNATPDDTAVLDALELDTSLTPGLPNGPLEQ